MSVQDRFADERSRRYYTLAKRPMRTTENLLSSNTAPSHGRNRRTNTGDRVSRRKSRATIRRQRRLRVCCGAVRWARNVRLRDLRLPTNLMKQTRCTKKLSVTFDASVTFFFPLIFVHYISRCIVPTGSKAIGHHS